MQIFKILDDLFNQRHCLLEQFHPDIYISSWLSLIISYHFNNINYDIKFCYFNCSFGVLCIPFFSLHFAISIHTEKVRFSAASNKLTFTKFHILFLQNSKH